MVSKTIQLWFGVIFTAVAPIVIGLKFNEYQVAWIAALCGAFITLMAKPEALAELSLGPLKAKMQNTIAEATATVGQLREVAATVANVVLSDLIAGHFMWGMSFKKRLELHDELILNLQKLGVAADQIGHAELEWKRGIGVVYHNKMGHDLQQRARDLGMDGAAAQKCAEEFNALAKKDTRSAALPDEYEQFFSKHGLLSIQIKDWVDDYRHFMETNEVRRSEFEKD